MSSYYLDALLCGCNIFLRFILWIYAKKSRAKVNQVESKCQRLDSNVLITSAAVMRTVTSRCNARKVHQITFFFFNFRKRTSNYKIMMMKEGNVYI